MGRGGNNTGITRSCLLKSLSKSSLSNRPRQNTSQHPTPTESQELPTPPAPRTSLHDVLQISKDRSHGVQPCFVGPSVFICQL